VVVAVVLSSPLPWTHHLYRPSPTKGRTFNSSVSANAEANVCTSDPRLRTHTHHVTRPCRRTPYYRMLLSHMPIPYVAGNGDVEGGRLPPWSSNKFRHHRRCLPEAAMWPCHLCTNRSSDEVDLWPDEQSTACMTVLSEFDSSESRPKAVRCCGGGTIAQWRGFGFQSTFVATD
jgi:hypothetical protein